MTGAMRRAAPHVADEEDVLEPPSAPSEAASFAPVVAAAAVFPAEDALVAALHADAAEFAAWLAAGKSAYKSIFSSAAGPSAPAGPASGWEEGENLSSRRDTRSALWTRLCRS
jgi:hypothetical protein